MTPAEALDAMVEALGRPGTSLPPGARLCLHLRNGAVWRDARKIIDGCLPEDLPAMAVNAAPSCTSCDCRPQSMAAMLARAILAFQA